MIIARAAAAALLGTFLSTAALAGEEGPIRSVTLSSGGLAELVREASVVGSATVEMKVPLDQVDDVLKSLVVLDPEGSVKGVSLDGPAPVDETFRTLPFSPADLASLPALLGALQGSEVAVSSGGQTASGRILGVEIRDRGDGETLPLLTLMDPDGRISTLRLSNDATAEFADPDIRRKLADAVSVAGRGRADGSRTISVAVEGDGQRGIGLSYVVAAPVWKTAYRVVTGRDGTARLQAWAVLENASGEDWNGVEIVLSSGDPVTLRQRLHQRYWKERQEVPVSATGRQAPNPDSGNMAVAQAMAPVPPQMRSFGAKAELAEGGYSSDMSVSMAAPEMMARASDTGTASEGDVSASYRLPGRYDLANGATLSVPIADVEVPSEMVSLYTAGQGDTHPVAAVSIENTTGTSLPGGILTVYGAGDGYVGDARLLGLPAGDTRLASFASDGKVTVVESVDSNGETVSVEAVDGVLFITVKDRRVTSYVISGAKDGDRTVIIEHPRMEGWIFSSENEAGATASHHRMKASVASGKSATVKAVQEVVRRETYSLADTDPQFLLSMAGKATPEVRAAIADLAAAQSQRSSWKRRLDAVNQSIGEAERTQARTRENLAALPDGNGPLTAQYLEKLTQSEKRIVELEAERAKAWEALRAAEEKVGEAIRSF